MSVGILGRKIGMTQIYDADGAIVQVTVIEAGPCVVLQLRTRENDGYDAVQLASALTWQESVGEEIVLATFDQQLWEAARRSGLKAWPDRLLGATSEPEEPPEQEEGA